MVPPPLTLPEMVPCVPTIAKPPSSPLIVIDGAPPAPPTADDIRKNKDWWMDDQIENRDRRKRVLSEAIPVASGRASGDRDSLGAGARRHPKALGIGQLQGNFMALFHHVA